MPLGLDTANLDWLESPSKSQKASELSLSAEALILGLVLEFDLLTESVRAGWGRGAKLLQGLILSSYLTENSCCIHLWLWVPAARKVHLGHFARTEQPLAEHRRECPVLAVRRSSGLFCVIHLPHQLPRRGAAALTGRSPVRGCDLHSSG